jgi:hypothetical protein
MADLPATTQYSRADLNPADTQRYNAETREDLRRRIKENDSQNQVCAGHG